MSSWPGSTLEDFLMWNYDLVVDGDGGANPSAQIAEILGTATRPRPRITAKQFAPIVALFEPYREAMERHLNWYDEANGISWRDYAPAVADQAPNDVYDKGLELVRTAQPSVSIE